MDEETVLWGKLSGRGNKVGVWIIRLDKPLENGEDSLLRSEKELVAFDPLEDGLNEREKELVQAERYDHAMYSVRQRTGSWMWECFKLIQKYDRELIRQEEREDKAAKLVTPAPTGETHFTHHEE
jgi:hypothetical protein